MQAQIFNFTKEIKLNLNLMIRLL